MKLHHTIALERGKKTQLEGAITRSYHLIQKDGNKFYGITRTYSPVEEGGETFPTERTNVQLNATNLIEEFRSAWGELTDITATKDWANTLAKADVVLDGQTILAEAPITFLIWLEKRLIDVRTFIMKLPTLPPEDTWHWDDNADAYVTDESITHKSKKVPRNHVKAEATPQHAAQVEVYHEDVKVGEWHVKKFSGSLPAATIKQYLDRVEALRAAVIAARETANESTVTSQEVGATILNVIFG